LLPELRLGHVPVDAQEGGGLAGVVAHERHGAPSPERATVTGPLSAAAFPGAAIERRGALLLGGHLVGGREQQALADGAEGLAGEVAVEALGASAPDEHATVRVGRDHRVLDACEQASQEALVLVARTLELELTGQ